jgi:hypothetical protein
MQVRGKRSADLLSEININQTPENDQIQKAAVKPEKLDFDYIHAIKRSSIPGLLIAMMMLKIQ